MNIILLRPWWLLALLPLAYLIWLTWQRRDEGNDNWRNAIDSHLMPHILEPTTGQPRWLRLVLVAVGGLLTVLALSGPALKNGTQSSQKNDQLSVLLVDLSGQGETPEQAKRFADQLGIKLMSLLNTLPAGQVALIAYAGEPYLIVPPTVDVATIMHFVPELLPEVMPIAGDQPEKAWQMAQALFGRVQSQNLRQQQGQLIWLTNASDAVAASLPAIADVPINILYGGSLATPRLSEIAQRSSGDLIRMRIDNTDIQQLLHKMKISTQLIESGQGVEDIGYWLLLPLLVMVIIVFRLQMLAIMVVPFFSISLLAMMLTLCTPQPALAGEFNDNLQGWLLLSLGDHQGAAEKFSDPHWRAIAYYRSGNFFLAAKLLEPLTDAKSRYNRGNALARMGNYNEALKDYERSLALRFDIKTQDNRDLMKLLLTPPPNPQQGTEQDEKQSNALPPKSKRNSETEAQRVAEQWLRGVPDEPAKLLKRKLQQEQARRESKKLGLQQGGQR